GRACGHRVEGRLVGKQRAEARGPQRPGGHRVAELAQYAEARVDVDVARPPERAHAPPPARPCDAARRSRRLTPTTVNRPSPAMSALSSPGRTCTTSPGPTAWAALPSRTVPWPSMTVNTVS